MIEIMLYLMCALVIMQVIHYCKIIYIKDLHIKSLEKNIERLEKSLDRLDHNNKFLTLLLNGKSEEFAEKCLGGNFK